MSLIFWSQSWPFQDHCKLKAESSGRSPRLVDPTSKTQATVQSIHHQSACEAPLQDCRRQSCKVQHLFISRRSFPSSCFITDFQKQKSTTLLLWTWVSVGYKKIFSCFCVRDLNPCDFKWNILPYGKTWNNFLTKIVKYLTLFDVKWNLPTFASANISHLRSKYFTAKLFHLPVRANFVEKTTGRNLSFFLAEKERFELSRRLKSDLHP